MKKRTILLLCAFLATAVSAFAQIKVTGVVTDAKDGAPIPFASVVVKNSTTGTAANADGNYAITVPSSKSVLVFSSIGYVTQEVENGGRSVINVMLATDAESIDEVMVVAYGTATKTSFTGSAGKVSGDKIELVPATNPLNTLNGTTPGLRLTSAGGQPGADASITVRGIGSINGNTDPLIVLDGMVYSGNLATIPAGDIDQITVLKDAASTALYGSRAANGVIMITTKQGKGETPKINVKISHGFVTREQKDYKNMDLPQYMENYWSQIYNNYTLNGKSEAEAAAQASKDVVTTLGYTENVYPWSGVAYNEVVGTDGKYNTNAKFLYEGDTDWLGATERVGQVQDYTISGSGRTKYTTYFGSASYTNNQGYMVGTGFDRYSARANVSFEKKWLKFGVNTSASVSDQYGNLSTSTNDRNNAFHVVLKMPPMYPIHLHYNDGSYIKDENGDPIYDFGEGYVYDGQDIPARQIQYNVVAYQNARFSHYKRNIINAKPYVEVTFLKDFKLAANVAVYNSDYTAHSATPYFKYYKATSTGVTFTHSNTYTFSANQLLTWNRAFGDHHVDALLGHESYQYVYDYETSSKVNQTIIGDNYQLNNYTTVSAEPAGYRNTYNTEGYFGRFNYDYNGKYFLSASYRRDGTSKFHRDVRWGNFWSVGGSWMISNEEFMRNNGFFDMLKFRASIGTVGSDDLGSYFPYMALYEKKQNDTEAGYAPVQDSPGNYNLQWEVSTNWDAALEFSALSRRLTGSVEYFNRQTSKLLLDVALASSTGKTSYPSNDGGLVNSGWEIQLGYDLIRTKNVKWNISANTSLLRNVVTSLPIPAYTRSNNVTRVEEGHSVYDWYLYHWAGVDPKTGLNYFELGDTYYKDGALVDGLDSNPDVISIDGKYYTTAITTSKLDFCGTSIPKAFGGLSTDLTIGRFNLAVNLYYQLGGKGYDRGYANILQQGIIGDGLFYINRSVDAAKSWRKEGDVTDYAILTTSTKAVGTSTYAENTTANRSTRWLVTSNMLEINNITMSYSFSKKLCNTLNLEDLKLFASADHLAIWNARRGYYTNYSLSNYSSSGAFAKPARTITVGLNFTL